MKRFLQVLSLGAAALLFAATVPGIAAADNNKHYGNYEKPYKPYLKPYDGYKNYGHYRRDRNRRDWYADRRYWDNNRPYRDERRFRRGKPPGYWHDHGGRRHAHYGHRHRHRHWGHRHRHGPRYGTYFGLHFYPQFAYPYPSAATPPPAYPVQPQGTYAQPAVIEQPPLDNQAPSTCLMTREYQTEIVVGGEVVPAYGEACLQPDGSWYRGPAFPEKF